MKPLKPHDQEDPQEIAQDLAKELAKFREQLKGPRIFSPADFTKVVDSLLDSLEQADALDLPKPLILLILQLIEAVRRSREEFWMRFDQAQALRKKQKQEQSGGDWPTPTPEEPTL